MPVLKRILFLGAAPTQTPPIRYAREQGHYVITCDYLPDNPGHALAHESHNVSTTDQDAVLALARRLRIDGIIAYASDPAAPTAAYVANAMGLPSNPYEAVLTLARKDLFRAFLKRHGFNVPRSESFDDLASAAEWLGEIGLPAYVKPVDSSGSKGVSRLTRADELAAAFQHALVYSRAKKVVVESEIPRSSYQVAGDGFVVDGRLTFRCWADEHFDPLCTGLVPIGESFPSSHPEERLAVAHRETQRLLGQLGITRGALNFDFAFAPDGSLYFLELGPRNGGCLIPEVIRYSAGVDLIRYTVDSALDLPCDSLQMRPCTGYWSSYMVHALQDGVYGDLWISGRLRPKIVEQTMYVRRGAPVRMYRGSNDTLGGMILRFESRDEMLETLRHMERDLRVVVQ